MSHRSGPAPRRPRRSRSAQASVPRRPESLRSLPGLRPVPGLATCRLGSRRSAPGIAPLNGAPRSRPASARAPLNPTPHATGAAR